MAFGPVTEPVTTFTASGKAHFMSRLDDTVQGAGFARYPHVDAVADWSEPASATQSKDTTADYRWVGRAGEAPLYLRLTAVSAGSALYYYVSYGWTDPAGSVSAFYIPDALVARSNTSAFANPMTFEGGTRPGFLYVAVSSTATQNTGELILVILRAPVATGNEKSIVSSTGVSDGSPALVAIVGTMARSDRSLSTQGPPMVDPATGASQVNDERLVLPVLAAYGPTGVHSQDDLVLGARQDWPAGQTTTISGKRYRAIGNSMNPGRLLVRIDA